MRYLYIYILTLLHVLRVDPDMSLVCGYVASTTNYVGHLFTTYHSPSISLSLSPHFTTGEWI